MFHIQALDQALFVYKSKILRQQIEKMHEYEIKILNALHNIFSFEYIIT